MPLTVEQVLVQELLDTAGVTSLVGTRIYPQAAPQGTLSAYVTYELVASNPFHDLSGAGGLTWARVSFLCHAPSYATAKGLSAAIRAAIDGRRGTIQSTTIKGILQEEEADAGFDEETRMHVVAVDFRVLY